VEGKKVSLTNGLPVRLRGCFLKFHNTRYLRRGVR